MRDIVTENPGRDVRRYLRHWANREYVATQLEDRQSGLTREQRQKKAREVAVCVQQGLEYLETSDQGTPLTAPLPLFYASENLAKATCVFLDPSLGASDFMSHGLRRDTSKRYSIKTLSATVLKAKNDVWSHYLRLGNKDRVSVSMEVDGAGEIHDLEVGYSPRIKAGRQINLGELLRLIPELIDDVRAAGWGSSYAVHTSSYRFVLMNKEPGQLSRQITLRHRHDTETKDLIRSREGTRLRAYKLVRDKLDVLEYRGTTTDPKVGMPGFRADMFGELYFDLNQSQLDLADPLVYMASLFILSSAIRYDPEQWQRLLENRPAEAILIDRMLEVASRRIPNLVLNALEDTIFQFKVAP